jgi:glycosyltransferase involved in cell wall biosynthesis
MPTAEPQRLATPQPLPTGLRVALVHDWLTGMRGGENCLEVFCEIFPQAHLYTLLHLSGRVSPTIEALPIHTSFLQKLPVAARSYRWALPLFPRAIESFDLSAYDLVLSSSHSVAKAAIPAAGALAVCYCFTPMRYVWDRFDDYFGEKSPPVRWAIGRVAARLRRWDRATAARVQLWLPISHEVQRRVTEFYGIDSQDMDIIYPPVDTDLFRPDDVTSPPSGLQSRAYDLVVSALVPYKRIDLAIQAAVAVGRHLVIVGQGPEKRRLQRLAGDVRGPGRVSFAPPVASSELPAYYAHCRAFIFPGHEDFGITPLEATACGRPVVAYRAGGALDTVREGLNGLFFAEQTSASLSEALRDERLAGAWDTDAMVAHARSFSRVRFAREITARLSAAWQRFRRGEPHV